MGTLLTQAAPGGRPARAVEATLQRFTGFRPWAGVRLIALRVGSARLMLAPSKYCVGGVVGQEDEYAALGRELGMFLRRWLRMQDKRGGPHTDGLDRAAYMLLGRVVGDGPGRLSALAVDMCVDLSVVSRQVAALEAAGLVARTTDPVDRRASLIGATDAGAELFRRERETFLALLRTLLADWTSAERAEFAHLLGRFNVAMAANEEGKLGHGND
jgi:DNA-binding MarR family transcriptional regulator